MDNGLEISISNKKENVEFTFYNFNFWNKNRYYMFGTYLEF